MRDRGLRFEELCIAREAVRFSDRGGFRPETEDHLLPGTVTLILVGDVGQAKWQAVQIG